jgi:tetratricopeptide (TPR) repeat protein
MAKGRFQEAAAACVISRQAAQEAIAPVVEVDAALDLASIELDQNQIDLAVGHYNEAGTLARAAEERIGEGLANIGLAQVMLHRELWDEALERFQEVLPRFRGVGDVNGQGTTLIGIGLAQRSLGNYASAQNVFAEAAELYRAAEQPLGEAEALYGHGSALVPQERQEEATQSFDAAIERVERTMPHLAAPDDRAFFLRRWVNLYADAIISNLRTGKDERANALADGFAARAGGKELAAQLKAFEESLANKDHTLTKEQQEQQKHLARRIGDLRKRLR